MKNLAIDLASQLRQLDRKARRPKPGKNSTAERKRRKTDGGRDGWQTDIAKSDFAKTGTAGVSPLRAKPCQTSHEQRIFKEQINLLLHLPNDPASAAASRAAAKPSAGRRGCAACVTKYVVVFL
jgi:hypothetical protein